MEGVGWTCQGVPLAWQVFPNHGAPNPFQVLEGLEPVRKRPGMYIGSTGQVGLGREHID